MHFHWNSSAKSCNILWSIVLPCKTQDGILDLWKSLVSQGYLHQKQNFWGYLKCHIKDTTEELWRFLSAFPMQEWPQKIATEVLLSGTGIKAADFMFRWNCLDLIRCIPRKYIWKSFDLFLYCFFSNYQKTLQEGYGWEGRPAEIATSKEPGLQTQEQEPPSRPGRAGNWVLHDSYRYIYMGYIEISRL